MMPPWRRAATSLIVILLGSLLRADYTYPPQKRGDMEARLTVRAAERTPEQGRGEVTLTLTVKGPATLEVEVLPLGDPTAAWKEERLPSTRVIEKDRATWRQIIRLQQEKPGVVPVPEVSVRFRGAPTGDWQEAKWVDILKTPRDVPGPPAPPPAPSSRLGHWGFALILGLVGLLLLGGWMVKRRRARQRPPLPPDQWALGELGRIERTLLPPHGDAEVFHTQLSHVIRRYLAERFGLHALQQTTAEFLDAVRQLPQLSAEQQALLREFFERCDLAKFARASSPPEECRRTAELAHQLVRQTTVESARRR